MRCRALSVCAAVAALLGAAVLVVPVSATTVPRTCGTVAYKGKQYLIRTHLFSCSKGKPYATRYLKTHKAPRGWHCTLYDPSQTNIRFVCRRSGRDFMAIRK